MIELSNITMSYDLEYGRLDVLSGIDLEIAEGETVAIVGPSGSGKTTLLILLAGLEHPVTGAVKLEGRTLGELDQDALADIRRDQVGIVFQSFHLVPSLTALGNVALPLEIAGRANASDAARQILSRAGLAGPVVDVQPRIVVRQVRVARVAEDAFHEIQAGHQVAGGKETNLH